ncbi:MAG TPA: GNAT family N-acetyltransferase [Acidimicrobiia bacterium]
MSDDTPPEVTLRSVTTDDLPTLFEFEQDPDANWMVAFTAKDPSDREAFMAHWDRLLADARVRTEAILVDGVLVGSIVSFAYDGQPNVGYRIGRRHWGQGITTRALAIFVSRIPVRPVYGRVVSDNLASRRVLEKCGFTLVGQERSYANARGGDVDELILRLE